MQTKSLAFGMLSAIAVGALLFLHGAQDMLGRGQLHADGVRATNHNRRSLLLPEHGQKRRRLLRPHLTEASVGTDKESFGRLQSENRRLKDALLEQQRLNWERARQVAVLSENTSHPVIILSSPQNNPMHTPYYRPPVVFGHMHISKTGGTTLNGNLSVLFERVCGHRGYSYDAYQANERFKKHGDEVNAPQNDSIAKAFKGFSRIRVPLKIREEIGFEDCDWISQALTRTADNPRSDWRFWGRFESWDLPVQLHVPCRDPVDHLLSQCNHRQVKFSCTGNALDVLKHAKACLYITGFSKELVSAFR